MRRYLVIANQTLGGDVLLSKIRERTSDQPGEFYLLVPATSPMRLDAETYGHSVSSASEAQAKD
jgi:hypothetical protein